MHAMQPTGPPPMLDRGRPEAERMQLAARNHAVLPAGKLGDARVDGTRSTKWAHIAQFVDFVRHAPIVAANL
jgi:hypothetical protein